MRVLAEVLGRGPARCPFASDSLVLGRPLARNRAVSALRVSRAAAATAAHRAVRRHAAVRYGESAAGLPAMDRHESAHPDRFVHGRRRLAALMASLRQPESALFRGNTPAVATAV